MSRVEILSKIKSDSEKEALSIIENANNQATQIIEQAQSKADEIFNLSKSKTLKECQDIISKRKAQARLELKKMQLATKNEIINLIYKRALEKVLREPQERQFRLIERLILENANTGDTVKFANGFDFSERLKQSKVFKEKQLKISTETANIVGGIILSGEKTDLVLSFEAMLESDKEKYVADIATKIFGEND